MEEMFKIGQVAKLYGISLDTLRLYERKGLLIPHVCKDNRYRYYSVDQFDTLELILNSKNAGMSLQDIAQILKSNDLFYNLDRFKEQAKVLEEKIKLLERTKQYTKEKIKIIEQISSFQNDYALENEIEYATNTHTLYLIDFDLLVKIGSNPPQTEGMELLETWRVFHVCETHEPIEDRETAIFSFQPFEEKSVLEKDFLQLYEKGYIKIKKITNHFIKFSYVGTNEDIQQYIYKIVKKTRVLNSCAYVKNRYTVIDSENENKYFVDIYFGS